MEESAFDIVESMDESNDVVLDCLFDIDAIQETRVETSVESALDSAESVYFSDDIVVNIADDTDATSYTRFDAFI